MRLRDPPTPGCAHGALVTQCITLGEWATQPIGQDTQGMRGLGVPTGNTACLASHLRRGEFLFLESARSNLGVRMERGGGRGGADHRGQ